MNRSVIAVKSFHSRRAEARVAYAASLARNLCAVQKSVSTIDEALAGMGDDDILVHDAQPRPDVTTLIPADESDVWSRGKGMIMIPCGADRTAICVAAGVLPIARDLGVPVVAYHTTWRDMSKDFDDPRRHRNDQAAKVSSEIQALADEAGVLCTEIVEMADEVVNGAVLHALVGGCSIIAVGRSGSILKGGYAGQFAAMSPVPILIVGSKEVR